jgi:serine/threonine protein kinase/tetratricopeptide (TPR) repeat protein
MGEVYRARDTRLGREVALKFLRAEGEPDRIALARFETEARAASALNHPSIVHIYDIGEVELSGGNGEPVTGRYIAMELVDGFTLRQYMVKGLDQERLLGWAADVADGLGAAHAAGIVHRDLKPENIMISADGRAKIVDFGLAKHHPILEIAADTESPTTPLPTEPGTIVGTVAYMSPEHLKGAEVDPRSDVFALGLIMYEALTAKRPFRGSTTIELLHNIAYEIPAPMSGEVPAGVRSIVMTCLEKSPDRRYQSCAVLAADLRAAIREPDRPRAGRPDRRTVAVVAAITLVVAAPAMWLAMSRDAPGHEGASLSSVASVAVLPFENQSGDPELDYLGDGFAESIILSFSRVPSLRVMSRSSSFQFRPGGVSPEEAGRRLGVDAVLVGRILERGDTLSLAAELVSSGTGLLLWGERYEGSAGELIEMQEGMAREIAASLRRTLTADETIRIGRNATSSPEAYREYLKGRFFWNKRTAGGMQQAVRHFEAALEHDPAYAQAWVGLGDTFALLEQYAGIPSRDNCPRALSAVRRALDIDPGLAAAHASMGLLSMHCEWDWLASERAFVRAIEIDPSYATARHWYSLHLGYRGKFERSLAEAERAVALDPLSPIVNNVVSVAHEYARNYEETIRQSDSVLDMAPDFPVAHVLKARGLRGLGRLEEATEQDRIAIDLTGGRYPEAVSGLAIDLALSGSRSEALAIRNEIMAALEMNPTAAYQLAKVDAALGDIDSSLRWLELAREAHSWHLVESGVEPTFDPLRTTAEFRELVRTVGLGRE